MFQLLSLPRLGLAVKDQGRGVILADLVSHGAVSFDQVDQRGHKNGLSVEIIVWIAAIRWQFVKVSLDQGIVRKRETGKTHIAV